MRRIFAFRGNGEIRQFEGGYSDYDLKITAERECMAESQKVQSVQNQEETKSKTEWKKTEKKLKFTFKEQREYDVIDEEIAELEEKIETLEEQILKAASDYGKLNRLMQEKEEQEKMLEEKMERWVYLNDLAEKIEAQS